LFGLIAVFAVFIALRSGRGDKQLAFHQLNFRREAIFQAAFAGDTIVYSAATSDNTPQIFAVRPDYLEPQPIGPRGMTLLAVSSKGELAVLLNAHYFWYRLFTGTLARMTLSGGAPREIEEGVRQADWSPDGSQLAIIREVGGKDRLEYPIGHVLREVTGSMSDVRFCPKGDRIAFFEHPRKLDDRGSVNTVDLFGKQYRALGRLLELARSLMGTRWERSSLFGKPEWWRLCGLRSDESGQDSHRLPAAGRF
jgi:hypothetical protein